ncbi:MULTISPECIES: universal stress protein [Pseudomonas]|uniref:universal stress protein n=1 Tax=Pseudomonas TaxID=286 RepID=UPI0002F13709|nr:MULTISPECIES: universal stress protein [Pseudomonas]MBH3395419.1 universal stress protein [Pseudomonas monteilii]MCJ7853623.1 universal stress protein [Pseudomonas monteilii]NBB04509.1 universal stress protein [Pseudomonas monteilii]SNS85718.1 Nucleotide-binding universal stress protein, UspA family [Pseudomonas sp. LAMO17WK12:I8]SNY18408.1 Nucleotide-binding universal stress protein, UspA family [Pseudomonas sp. LAMO17WK12:I11]
MNPLKHILVATDLSPYARNAAERAAYLSKAQQASLDLLYVANPAPFERLKQLVVPDDDLLKRVLDSAGEKIHALAAMLFQRYDISAGVQVASGSVTTEITRVVQDKHSSLLVCGARGQGVARRLLLGSTVQKMLNRMPCPLLVVKPAPRDAYRTVLVPVDFSPVSLRAIELARRIAPQAEIILLHVYEAPFESSVRFAHIDHDTLTHYRNVIRKDAVTQLAALSQAAGMSDARQIVVHGDPGWRIAEQEQELECDLIVVGKQGTSALEELLVGSVTKHVLNESQCDVLVSP